MSDFDNAGGAISIEGVRVTWRTVALAAGLGLVALAGGYALLATWEVAAAGRDCGVPFDNPGWVTGDPCHGAVNRRTAVGLVISAAGVSGLIVAAVLGARVLRLGTRSGG